MAFNVLRGLGARTIQGALPKKVFSTPPKRKSSTFDEVVIVIDMVGGACAFAKISRAFQKYFKQKFTTLTPEQRLNVANNIVGFGTLAGGLAFTGGAIAIDQIKEMTEDKTKPCSDKPVHSSLTK